MKHYFGLITIFAIIFATSVGKVANAQIKPFTYQKPPPILSIKISSSPVVAPTLFQDAIKARDDRIAAEKKKAQEAAEKAVEAQKEEQAALQQPAQIPQARSTPQVYHSNDYYVNWIIQHESGGNPNNVNSSSGACGLFQKVPCNVPLGDVAAQMADGLQYINSRYGSPYNAYLFWVSHGWY